MTLPPPPDSFFEGGDPLSQVAPGDTGRELVHEAKNLAQAVLLLNVLVRKQRIRQRQFLITGLISLLALTLALGYSRYLSVEQSRQRIQANHAACDQDRDRGEIEIEILEASAAKNPDSMSFFAPRIMRFKALQKDCEALYPSPGDQNWPTFLG